jgi:cysteine desulfurase family protein (TIGR01976 family)
MLPFDVARERARYPALREAEVVYLDNAAGAQLPDSVVEAVRHALVHLQVNKGGAYAPSRRVTEAKERVRSATADFVRAAPDTTVAFGPNATTLVTLLAQAYGDALRQGDEVVISGLDHHANVDPWRSLSQRGVVVRRWQPRAPTMTLHVEDLQPLLNLRTRVVAFTAASNALGTRSPVAEISAAVHAAGAKTMVDLVHLAPHERPDLTALGVDMAVFSPYKVIAPHLGVLLLSAGVRDQLQPPRLSFMDPDDPVAWEPGTSSHEAIIGWGAALEHLARLGRELLGESMASSDVAWTAAYRSIASHERDLCERLLTGLDRLGMERYGLPGVEGRTATVSFNHPELTPRAVAEQLGAAGIAVAAGHYYAYDLMMKDLGLASRGGAVRASALHYNDANDIDALLTALARV